MTLLRDEHLACSSGTFAIIVAVEERTLTRHGEMPRFVAKSDLCCRIL